jgi:hypothetical protein
MKGETGSAKYWISLVALSAGGIASALDLPAPRLSIDALAPGNVHVTCAGLANFYYQVEATATLKNPSWTVISTNATDNTGLFGFTIPNANNSPMRFYRAILGSPKPGAFLCGLLVKQSIIISGGMVIDSFNSQDPNYSTAGLYDPTKYKDGGDIGTICVNTPKAITGSGGAKVYGHLDMGLNDTADAGNASCGSKDWVNAGNSGIQPGWLKSDMDLPIPDVTLPSLAGALPMVRGNYAAGGTNYTYLLNNTTYQASSKLALSGGDAVLVTGNVILYLPGSFTMDGTAFIYIAPNSSLTCYCGDKVTLAGGGVVNGTSLARNCAFFGLPSSSSFNYSGGASFVGTIYAPEADFTMSGGGTGQQLIGAIVAQSANISGSYLFHYDESLRGR